CRDTFASLKKTCRKQGISFWHYLLDRLSGTGTIAPLPELIRQSAVAGQLTLCCPGLLRSYVKQCHPKIG
ncbi:MAG: hypothetical protein O7D86_05155, partial [Proteobacteria bacterium]|nr:hypothetical protein [Pseudomonadota bacterium]